MRAWCMVLLVACGSGDPEPASFEVVGHTDLGARGMNAAIAVAGTSVYVGSRIDSAGIAIQDGLIYVVDVRNGLYVLRYRGPFAEQVTSGIFLEGNSNL